MATIKLTIEYDGTAYVGWQRQPNQPTIQAALETALTRITQQHISVIAAGRTDAGVHARGQVVSFQSDKSIPIHKWGLAINSALPHDISVLSSEEVPESFHARYSAKEKLYEYRISRHPARPAIDRNRVWHLPYDLDIPAIRQAMPGLIGCHDFTSFQGPHASTSDPMCRVPSFPQLGSHVPDHSDSGQSIPEANGSGNYWNPDRGRATQKITGFHSRHSSG